MKDLIRKILGISLLCALLMNVSMLASGCEQESDLEEATEETAESVEDTAEEAGDEMEEATD